MLNNLYKLFFSKLYKFQGRSSRKEYIARLLLTIIVFMTWIYTVDFVPNSGFFAFVYVTSLFFCMVLMFFQYFPLAVRRLHDFNVNGWWILISFIPGGQLIVLWLIFKKGTSGANKYGQTPF